MPDRWTRLPPGWRILTFMAIFWGGFMGMYAALPDLLRGDWRHAALSLGVVLLAGLAYGTVMAGVLTLWTALVQTDWGRHPLRSSAPHQRRILHTPLSPPEAEAHMRAALHRLRAPLIAAPEAGVLVARQRLSGVVLTLRLTPEDTGTCVEIEGTPWISTVILDMGASFRQVEVLAQALEAASSPTPAVQERRGGQRTPTAT